MAYYAMSSATSALDAGRSVIRRSAALATLGLEQAALDVDLVVRDPSTGEPIASIPSSLSGGMVPIVRAGLVVGYYKDSCWGKLLPVFDEEWSVSAWPPRQDAELWLPIISDRRITAWFRIEPPSPGSQP